VGGSPAEDPARHRLQDLLAPALGLGDGGDAIGVGREERRVRLQLLERPRDPARALNPATVDPKRRHGSAPEPGSAQLERVEAGEQVDYIVLDALALEHQPRGLCRMGERERVELGGQAEKDVTEGVPGTLFG
jgi:hypothetical protein